MTERRVVEAGAEVILGCAGELARSAGMGPDRPLGIMGAVYSAWVLLVEIVR